MKPDYWELEKTPGYFADRNEGARWLQENPGDPYWMGHALANAMSHQGYEATVDFLEYWAMAREIKEYV